MKKTNRLMAKAFDAITCKNGHACYLTARALREGTAMSVDDYICLGSMKPVVLSIEVFNYECPECKAHIFEPSKDGNYGMTFYNRGKLMGEGSYVDESEDTPTKETADTKGSANTATS